MNHRPEGPGLTSRMKYHGSISMVGLLDRQETTRQ
jgi:hypothetical protein